MRDNEHVWFDSWINFFEKNFKGVFVQLATYGAWYGLFGEEVKRMTKIGVASMRILFGVDAGAFEQTELSHRFRTNREIMKARYRAHTLYVQSVVPPERLLIWNVKQGWAPLCKFLDLPVPDSPIPRKNTKGELFQEYSKSPFTQVIIRKTVKNLLVLMGLFTIFSSALWSIITFI